MIGVYFHVFELIVNKFVKDNSNVKDDTVRNSYGVLGGIIGIVVNIILFIIKLSVGVIVSSIAIMADAFNNLSDAASSLITILGFKLQINQLIENIPLVMGV